MIKLYSFDILDTCLSRSCGEPYAVFDILAKSIIGDCITKAQLADFRYIRIQAESNARKKCIREDVTLQEIYEECDFSGLTDVLNEEILLRELEIERSVLKPINKALVYIKKIHSENIPVVFISDMYLPSTFFVEILLKYGFWQKGDSIYVSCEIGKSKQTGHLYDYIFTDLNLSHPQWHHYGDNRHSDYNIPCRRGIRGHHIINDYSFYQRFLKGKDYDVSECYMGRAAGISRALLLAEPPSIRAKFATDIIAPLYVSFTYRILNNAKERGINRLFFLARDGYVIYRIAKEMSSHFPSIDIRYLHVSRKALYLPSLDNLSKESLLSILSNKRPKYDDEFFDVLQIDVEGLGYEEFMQTGLSPTLETKLKERWEEQKHNVIEYFKQEGLADNNARIGIVDIRGSRKCQRCVNKILSDNNFKHVHGYYLEVTNDRLYPVFQDEYDAFYFGDFHKSQNFTNMNVMTILLERYFCISYAKRTSGYKRKKDGYEPEFDNEEYLPEYYEEIGRLNTDVCINYCKDFFTNDLQAKSQELFNYSLSLISSFASSPRREYVKALYGVEFSESKYRSLKLVNKLYPGVLWNKDFKWFRGSLVLTFPVLLTIYKFIRKMSAHIINRIK